MTSSEPVTAQLILIQGDPQNFQQVIELRGLTQTIGRAQNSDISWGSLQISRRHATLEFISNSWFIKDTSTNGLSVNNTKLKKGDLHPLRDADIISFIPTGVVRYRFRRVTEPQRQNPSRRAVQPAAAGPLLDLPSAISYSSLLPAPSGAPPQIVPRIGPSAEPIFVDDSRSEDSDDSNRSESLLSVDPPEDYFGFSCDEPNSPPNLHESSASKRKHNVESSDSDNCTLDRKKKRVQMLSISDESSDADDDFNRGSNTSSAQPKNMTDLEINNCDDVKTLKEHLRQCVTKLSKAEMELEAIRCERDMEREEYQRREKDVTSVNEAFKEETYKKIMELMESELSCSVCNEVFIESTVIDCGHTFCSFCINEWGRKKSECPICRKSFRNRSRHIEMENYISRILDSMSEEISAKRKASIKEREEQAKKAAAEARAAPAANPPRHAVHNLLNPASAGRYIDFLTELQQINDILAPAPRPVLPAERRRRSARIQDQLQNAAAATGGRGRRGRGRAAAAAAPAPVPPPPVQPPRLPTANIPVVTLNDTQDDDGAGGLRLPNQIMNFVRDIPFIPHINMGGIELPTFRFRGMPNARNN